MCICVQPRDRAPCFAVVGGRLPSLPDAQRHTQPGEKPDSSACSPRLQAPLQPTRCSGTEDPKTSASLLQKRALPLLLQSTNPTGVPAGSRGTSCSLPHGFSGSERCAPSLMAPPRYLPAAPGLGSHLPARSTRASLTAPHGWGLTAHV